MIRLMLLTGSSVLHSRTNMNNPVWNPSNKSATLQTWANSLHQQSKAMFLKDKTHAHILFFFNDTDGLISVNPVPPKTGHMQINGAIKGAIKEHNLFGVIHVGEAWTYFPKDKKDHTAFQLLDGEMKVSDLNQQDKTEALYLRMESRDRDCVVYLNRIIRNGDQVELSSDKMLANEDLKWF
jgi:hypothetical protein